MTATTAPELGVERLFEMFMGFVPARVLAAAVQLDVFTPLAEGPRTLPAMAAAVSASERGTRMLLDTLVGMQVLGKEGERYRITPLARQYLVRSAPDYMGGLMESDRVLENWMKLPDAVRSGRPAAPVDLQEAAEQFFPILVRSLHVRNREDAKRAAQVLSPVLADAAEPKRLLDVACGSGVWGIAAAEAYPHVRVTAQDFPGLLEGTTKGYLERHGVQDRVDFLPGDLKAVDFGENRYDAAILGNIVHSEGEASARALFKKLHRALRPGGRVAIMDMVPNDERTGPPYPLAFALTMLLHTERGDVYTLAQYTAWLKAAGFARVETADIGAHSPLVIGIRD